jgi:predicted ester cyclase
MSAEQNKTVVRHMMEELWHGNLDVLNEHPGMHETIPFITKLFDSVDFSRHEVVQQLSDGDWVVTRFLSTGTHTKEFLGTPAGAHVHLETIMMHRVQNGKIVEQHTQGGQLR